MSSHRASVATTPGSRLAPQQAGFFCAVASLRFLADVAHRHQKRAWPRRKITSVKWFHLVRSCSRSLAAAARRALVAQGPPSGAVILPVRGHGALRPTLGLLFSLAKVGPQRRRLPGAALGTAVLTMGALAPLLPVGTAHGHFHVVPVRRVYGYGPNKRQAPTSPLRANPVFGKVSPLRSPPQRPHSSGVEHSLGKGEVESSNLSVGTIPRSRLFL